jgi:D-serine deaminase-like pyridoxal phosphate-dependent protein
VAGPAEENALRRDQLPTPCLVLDLDALDHNIAAMAAQSAGVGLALRPHAKSHKCVEIARRLARAGALGPASATIAEAEAMAAGGIGGILVTSPTVTVDGLDRLRRLLLRGADVTVTVDQPANLADLGRLARGAGRALPVVVDLDPALGRTGCATARDGLALARLAAAGPGGGFAGVQCYWGQRQNVMPIEARARRVAEAAAPLRELVEALAEAGLPAEIVTGGGTGTSWVDAGLGLFTEQQPGSFLFLDSEYAAIPITPDGNPFRRALFVAAAVVSANHPGWVTVNAGLKAFATDSGRPLPARGAPEGSTFRFMGDEHGAIDLAEGTLPPGHLVELLTPHCDPTVNLHGRYHVVQGDEVVDVWPIMARGY